MCSGANIVCPGAGRRGYQTDEVADPGTRRGANHMPSKGHNGGDDTDAWHARLAASRCPANDPPVGLPHINVPSCFSAPRVILSPLYAINTSPALSAPRIPHFCLSPHSLPNLRHGYEGAEALHARRSRDGMFSLLASPALSRDAYATCRHQHNTEESLVRPRLLRRTSCAPHTSLHSGLSSTPEYTMLRAFGTCTPEA